MGQVVRCTRVLGALTHCSMASSSPGAAGASVSASVAAKWSERFSSVVELSRMEGHRHHLVLVPRPKSRRRLAGPDPGRREEQGPELESGSSVAVETEWGSTRFGGWLVVQRMAILGIVV